MIETKYIIRYGIAYTCAFIAFIVVALLFQIYIFDTSITISSMGTDIFSGFCVVAVLAYLDYRRIKKKHALE